MRLPVKQLLLSALLALSKITAAQNYFHYQQQFNLVDQDVSRKDYAAAIIRLDSLQSAYKFIYARHCLKALQLCVVASDSLRANAWMARCFAQGVPFWMIRSNALTQRALLYASTAGTIASYDSLHGIYRSSIDTNLARRIDRMFARDQWYTRRVNDGFFLFRHTLYGLQWIVHNRCQFKKLNRIIDQYGFPGERLIGWQQFQEDSASFYKSFVFNGPGISDPRAFLMLVHYYSTPRKSIAKKLLANVSDGYLPAQQYGSLVDFMARFGKRKAGRPGYYNVWHQDPDQANLDQINARRNEIGLMEFEQQVANQVANRERRKNKNANTTIVLE